jgi:hypothetical protein
MTICHTILKDFWITSIASVHRSCFTYRDMMLLQTDMVSDVTVVREMVDSNTSFTVVSVVVVFTVTVCVVISYIIMSLGRLEDGESVADLYGF